MYIYKITNTINNKVYIGQTNNFKKRLMQHRNRAKSNNTKPFYKDIQKYGWDVFKSEILYETDDDLELNKMEQYYIAKFNTIEGGYNIRPGGNVMHMEDALEKHNCRMQSLDVRKKISNSLREYRKNNSFTEEHRSNLSKAMIGNHNFGDGDTRSIECFCIDTEGVTHNFHNYKEASKWWHSKYNPFNCKYNYATYRRKITDCINDGCCYYGRGKNKICVDNIKWYTTS